MSPVVIVAGRKAEYNPDKNRLTIQFLSPKQSGGKGDAGEIILINWDVPEDHSQSAGSRTDRHRAAGKEGGSE